MIIFYFWFIIFTLGVGSKLTLIEINLLFYLFCFFSVCFLHTLHADFVSWHMRYKQVLCVIT